MSFSVNIDAASKDEAMHKLESASNLPQSVRAFIALAIDGFKEPGGNHPIVTTDVATRKTDGGHAVAPARIKISASGHLDPAGNESTCTVKVSKA